MNGNGCGTPRLSIIVPVLNEAPQLEAFLMALKPWRCVAEIIVADGGSDDGSAAFAGPLCDAVLHAEAGRARQMNAGAARAEGEYLMFLHCDTRLTVSPAAMMDYLADRPDWGFFPVRLSGRALPFRVIERLMNVRSRLTHVATGDQCLFISRELWDSVRGFADIPLMEDVEFSKRLRRRAGPLRPAEPVITSSRRWEERGIGRTVLLMWWLRLRFWLGADPRRLAAAYRD